MIEAILIQSAIYWFMALGVWINLRVVRYADLAVESVLVFAAMASCAMAAAGLRGYLGFGLALTLSIPVALIIAGCAWMAWKPLGVHAIIVSLSLSFVLYSVALQAFGAMQDGTGLPKLRADIAGLVALYTTIAAVSLLLQLIRMSSAGRHLLAAVGNPTLARALGMRPGAWQWLGLSCGTLLMMISGVLHACYYTYTNIGDAVGFLLLGIFCAVLVANGLCPRVIGFGNGVAVLLAVILFETVITVAIYAGIPINLNKGMMGLLLIAVVAVLRYRRVDQPITLT